MDLSIIIVNYNVKHFLEQCLHSVLKASEKLQTEVIVVDNNSGDGSASMMEERFQDVKLIPNQENVGFSVANNQAIRESSGRYLLLLNPDTLVEEDCLQKCLDYMEADPECGGLGVKMIDGKGEFLPESKRALPTPTVAFYKIFGISGLFPKSKRFGRYHLSYLDRDQIHEVDVLPGAFMMLRKSALDKVGMLDETFFMYGEDIDLSYRLQKGGYRNIYFPETTIIHYKGESTKKGSLNYVMTFYNAMRIFARKHFSKNMARSYSLIINLAIYFRAVLALVRRFIRNFTPPAVQAVLIYLGFYLIKPAWEQIKFQGTSYYPNEYMNYVVPVYILIWLVSLYFSGAYDKPVKPFRLIRGVFAGTALILMIYALLPESLRFSRMLLLLGTAWAGLAVYIAGFFFHFTGIAGFRFEMNARKRILILGSEKESFHVKDLMDKAFSNIEYTLNVNPAPHTEGESAEDTGLLDELIVEHRINELVFCAADLSSKEIIRQMRLPNRNLQYKIAAAGGTCVIGSNSINTPGDIYLSDFESITKPGNKRLKRLFDFLSASSLLLAYPVLLFIVRHPGNAFRNIIKVITGRYSWVGFHASSELPALPSIRPGILFPSDAIGSQDIPQETKDNLNLLYVKNYDVFTDAGILIRSIREIGRKQESSLPSSS